MIIFIGIAIFVTISNVLNTLIIMMINGYSIKYARRYIYSDTVLLTIVGIILGMIVGSIMGNLSVKLSDINR